MTTDANEQLAAIQPRMPVIVEQADWPVWLGETEGNATALLRPAPEDVLRLWPVGKGVGNVRNDGPGLLEPYYGDRGTSGVLDLKAVHSRSSAAGMSR